MTLCHGDTSSAQLLSLQHSLELSSSPPVSEQEQNHTNTQHSSCLFSSTLLMASTLVDVDFYISSIQSHKRQWVEQYGSTESYLFPPARAPPVFVSV